MNFEKALKLLNAEFQKGKIEFALIGGLALQFAGVERFTRDIDFMVALSDSERVHMIMESLGYQALHRTQNVANYSGPSELGQVDFLFAQRQYGLDMLHNANPETFLGESIRVIRPEDIIGLKVQSSSNDPERADQDRVDIKNILRVNVAKLDMGLVREYFKVFDREEELERILSSL